MDREENWEENICGRNCTGEWMGLEHHMTETQPSTNNFVAVYLTVTQFKEIKRDCQQVENNCKKK